MNIFAAFCTSVLAYMPQHNIGHKKVICFLRGSCIFVGCNLAAKLKRRIAIWRHDTYKSFRGGRMSDGRGGRRQTSRRACGGGGASTNVSPVLLRVLAAMRPHRHLASSAVVYGVLEVILYFETFEHFEIRVISMSPPSYRNAKRRH